MLPRVFVVIVIGLGFVVGGNATLCAPSGGSAAASQTKPNPVTAARSPLKLKLPFPAGKTYRVIQGNNGTFTHTGFNEYAWDFGLPENSPVCAAASGRVVRVKQDGTTGGPSDEYFSQGNTIIIDHGNGCYSQYLHLAAHSSRVEEGDLVTGGQVIALSGNTGFSSMPHLHFDVQNPTGQSIPTGFIDVPGSGIPTTGQTVTSANDGTETTQYAGESFLPPDTFLKNSILLLTRDLPGHLYRSGREYPIHGRLTNSDARTVAVYFMGSSGGEAIYSVVAKVDPDGFFRTEIDPGKLKSEDAKAWHTRDQQSNPYALAIAPVNEDGSYWSDISVPVCVR